MIRRAFVKVNVDVQDDLLDNVVLLLDLHFLDQFQDQVFRDVLLFKLASHDWRAQVVYKVWLKSFLCKEA